MFSICVFVIFFPETNKNANSHKSEALLPPEGEVIIKEALGLEFEFYEYLRQRLMTQYEEAKIAMPNDWQV